MGEDSGIDEEPDVDPADDPPPQRSSIEEVSPILRPMLEKLSGEEARVLVTIVKAASYSGPIPSAEQLEQYKQIDPDLPRMIWKSSQAEQQHRHTMEHEELDALAESRKTGQKNALIFGLCALLALALIGIFGGPSGWVAATVVGTIAFTVIGGIYVFERLRGGSATKKEFKEEKEESRG